jgi:hypothetical protein
MSDGFASYNNVGFMNGGVYLHNIVIHENKFVHLDDGDVHTQNVELMWSRLKQTFKRMKVQVTFCDSHI